MKINNKYIVLSFDDARDNFYRNAFPLLEKYNMKCTLNVVSGFVDKSLTSFEYETCTSDQIVHISKCGHEIASHSHSHIPNETVEDMVLSIDKLSKLVGKKIVGCAMPFNQNISTDMYYTLKRKGVQYFRVGYPSGRVNVIKGFYSLLYKAFKFNFLFYKLNKLISLKLNRIKKKRIPFVFYSINAGLFYNADNLIKLIKRIKHGTAIIIMFHSVLNNNEEILNDSYRSGAFLTGEFEKLLKYLYNENNCKIVTNEELLKIATNK